MDTQTNTAASASQPPAAPARQLVCIACLEPITGDGYLIPAVQQYINQDGYPVAYRAPYHAACLPPIWAEQVALLGLQPIASA